MDDKMKITWDDFKECHEVCGKDCPWTGVSYGVDMGCLPSPIDFVKQALEKNEILSCHSNYKIPCIGIKDYLKNRGIDPKNLKLVPNDG